MVIWISLGIAFFYIVTTDDRIIDWDFTVAMPLQKATAWPKLLQYTPGNIPPGLDGKFMEHSADKIVFLNMLKNKEILRQGTDTISKLMETSYERNFFEMSLHMKMVHHEWAKAHPATPELCQGALEQLVDVLLKYPQFENETSMKVKMELERRINC